MPQLITESTMGGAVVHSGRLLACYSGNSGKTKAEAFHLALTAGETDEMKEKARLSGIAWREIERALFLRSEAGGLK